MRALHSSIEKMVFVFCAHYLLLLFLCIYMFDFIIIQVTIKNENKGTVLLRYEFNGPNAFY